MSPEQAQGLPVEARSGDKERRAQHANAAHPLAWIRLLVMGWRSDEDRCASVVRRHSAVAQRLLGLRLAMPPSLNGPSPHAAPTSSASVVRFGAFELDGLSGELRKGGTRVRLLGKPM
jgi:hypothetical protein